MKWHVSAATSIVVGVIGLHAVKADVPASERTAAMPDSWLVLYNADPTSESPAWKDWYIAQWGIPPENTLGLQVSVDERVTRDFFHSRIFYPVRDHLNAQPALKAKIMGIVVGFRVPGNFYLDDTHPPLNGGGGWSVSSNLTDLQYSTWYKRTNPHYFVASRQPNPTRLTKATLSPDCYLTARLDGPTLAAVKGLTEKARAISTAGTPLPPSEYLYYDYLDIGAPGGDEWTALRSTVESLYVNTPSWRFPWLAYESETSPMPSCAMHFSYYRIDGWDTVPWSADVPGSRLVAMALNSWGATTVRSTTAHGARFVPNALFNGMFAGALGATAEPYTGAEPAPSTIVWCLAEGRNLGEAVFHANPYRNYMWELVGDPLLSVPGWFVDPCQTLPPPVNLGPADLVTGSEIVDATPAFTCDLASRCNGLPVAFRLQVDQDADFSSPEIEYVSGLQAPGAASFTVGQPPADGGDYVAGGEGQTLPLGSYYWRVRAEDQNGVSAWADPGSTGPAFQVGEPLVLVRAVSRKMHGGSLALDINLALPPYSGLPTVEPRLRGPTQLLLSFNKPIRPMDGIIDGNEVQLSAGVLTSCLFDGNVLTLDLSSLPDKSCLAVTLSGITDAAGHAVDGDNRLMVVALLADANGSGEVTIADVSLIRSANTLGVTAATATLDINLDGTISVSDVSMARFYNGGISPCQ